MKYHIDINGRPVKCPAKIKCRRASPEEHFNSFEEAEKYSDTLNHFNKPAEFPHF